MSDPMLEGVGERILTFITCTLDGKRDARITNIRTVASFSWLNSPEAKIQVPGAPFLYTGFRAGLLKVSLDNGFDFVDQSRARLPEGRMLAPFQAIRHIRPNYDFNQHDFIIPRGSLKKLQLALSGEVQMEDFRIDIESNGHGGFICDKWNSDVTRDGQRDGRPGHRMGFDQATRRLLLGCEDMVTHSRCISYDFDGLSMLVSYEVDGFINNGAISPESISSTTPKSKKDLALLFDLFQSATSHAHSTTPTARALETIDYAGPTIAHSNLMELKTREIHARREFPAFEFFAQAFWAQMPLTVAAYHVNGRFIVEDRWPLERLAKAANAYASISRTASLLHKVKKMLGDKAKGEKFCIIYEKGALSLRKGGRGVGAVGLS